MLHPEPIRDTRLGCQSGTSSPQGMQAKFLPRQAHLLEHLQHTLPQRLVGNRGAAIDLLHLMHGDCREQRPAAIHQASILNGPRYCLMMRESLPCYEMTSWEEQRRQLLQWIHSCTL